MLRDLKIFRRNSANIPPTEGHNENLPLDPSDSSTIQLDSDSSRPPLNTIQEPVQNPRSGLEQEAILRRKVERTPSKNQIKGSDGHLPFRTPEKPAALRNKFGWVPKSDAGAESAEHGEESSHHGPFHLPPWSRGAGLLNGGVHGITTPRTYRTAGKASSVHSDCSSTQSTPTKSVTKPTYSGVSSSRPPLGTAARLSNFSAASKGTMVTSTPSSAVNVAEVPHFDLREDPSFWMDHNIQVVIRVRPLNSTERNLQGYNRCLKQESAQTVTWIGQPESRFTFDYVACETINQEMLFRVAGLPMVENCMSGYNSCMFAYGQTGSGKTYTMLGEIDELEISPSQDRGMTPRIFEFLFARIRAEEESRRDEKLRYNCKCSFLEIYNEQITDLLEPSSTNLLLREDLCKGVYVDNLAEFEVDTVQDILKLLIQGAANRKVAATNMNRESSRSHSVFTCVIESRWEKDSTTNLRFARLNLVDLAGSERQKTSGAEGERLKEAASINKSLSTLGHVIMVLADVANGKQRHIPYRDSRLTFLLQDSLGGNSKTIIMANVSPSICSASETLSTLKFAQRAKLIQNNAVVNEDASGDIIALQHQIHLLKEELSVLKRQNVSRSLSFRTVILEDSEHQGCDVFDSEKLNGMVHMNSDEFCQNEASCSVRVSTKQLKSLEATLAGALRREKMADIALKQLEAEIEHLNRLVRQREDDTQGSKMMLKFREDKIHRMEALLDGLLPTESYLLEENTAFSEEIKLLRTRADRNPEVTRFALENIRLLDQLRKFQDFYEEGERELLLAEVSELRNQLIQFLDGKSEKDQYPKADMVPQLKRTCQELEDCKNNLKSCLETNARLTREISNLQIELNNIRTSSIDQHVSVEPQNMEFGLMSPHRDLRGQAMNVEWTSEYTVEHTEEILNLQLELDILKTILGEEKSSRVEVEEKAIHANYELKAANKTVLMISKHSEDVKNELKDARAVIEALESQHLTLLNELEDLRENNSKNGRLLKKQEQEISILRKQLGIQFEGEGKLSFAHKELNDQTLKLAENEDSPLQLKMKRVQASLEKACSLSLRYQSDQASQTSIEQEMDEVRRQVEIETAEVIVCLQDELLTLQQRVDDSNKNELLARSRLVALEAEIEELNERLSLVTQENENLHELTEEKERDLRSLTEDWERLAYEIADVLTDGNVALENASDQVASISDSFPHRSWISEQVDGMIRSISERDALIKELQKHLEDAQNVRCDMEWKLSSLRGAALAITEAQQQETSDKESEILQYTSQLSEKNGVITELESRIKLGEEQTRKAEIRATVAFMTVNRLSEINRTSLLSVERAQAMLSESVEKNFQKDALLQDHISLHADGVQQIEALKVQLEQSQEHTSQLKNAQQEQAQALERQLQKEEEDVALSRFTDDLLKAKRVANEIKIGVCTLHSCISENAQHVSGPAEAHHSGNDSVESEVYDSEDLIEVKSIQTVIDNKHRNGQIVPGCSVESLVGKNPDGSKCSRLLEDTYNRETTIILLRKELESALDSLQEVQAQMVNLLDEKEEIKKSEIQSLKSMERLSAEVLRLTSDITDKEQQLEFRLIELERKLHSVEGNAVASNACWQKDKEVFELEITDSKALAAQKTAEASNLLNKIEEAQETMRDADIMVNALVEANESAKLEMERHKILETTLDNENKCLIREIQALQSSLDIKEKEYEYMQKRFQLNITEARSLVLELEDIFRDLEATSKKKFELMDCDLDWLNHQLHQYMELARAWLEETWSEIIGKDCAVSVLHLCHIGILLERITGLNAEKGFLYHGLCESNSLIADLREHNGRAKNELEICSVLKGKLLFDINNSFNRITKKEDETAKFKAKLNSFERKILSLQSQEESMLARSNSMGTELAILIKELDTNNRNALEAVSIKEKLLKVNEELHNRLEETTRLLDEEKCDHKMWRDTVFKELDLLVVKSDAYAIAKIDESCNMGIKNESGLLKMLLECQTKTIMRNMFAKDFELLVLASELEQKIAGFNQMAQQIVDSERQRGTFNRVIEKMKEDIILCMIEREVKNSEVCSLLVENEELKTEVLMLKEDHSKTTVDLQEAKIGFASSLRHINVTNEENCKLKDIIGSLEACIASLQTDLDRKNGELEEILCSHTVISKEFDLRKEITEMQVLRINSLEAENYSLKNEAMKFRRENNEVIAMLNFKLKHCFNFAQSANLSVDRMFHVTDDRIVLLVHSMCREIGEHKEMASKFFDELECLAVSAKELLSEKFSLQSELMRKDEVLKGLLFDLSLLQESASITKDQNDDLEEMAAKLGSLEDELGSTTCELDDAIAHGQALEAQLLDKNDKISVLELKITEKHTKLDLVSTENLELKAHIEQIVGMKGNIEQELMEKIRVAERLEEEILLMSTLLGQRNHCLEDLQNDMTELTSERDHLDAVVHALKEQLEMAQALAEENEAIATEARQIAEGSKVYAEDKEEEVRLLERSVEELECTVNALENKVEIVKGEAEKQRLQREELEMELEAVRNQMLTGPVSCNICNVSEGGKIDFSRHLKENLTELREAQKCIQFLQKEIADKDAEIFQCKAHISELNMHADAQAREYKQKFRELEAMAQQVRADTPHSSTTSLTSTKAEKGAAKSRGSGSPFKCIGLGLSQQINSEKDEELSAARCQIEELKDLAARRQKEVFILNTRLAAAESMTHDVIRDLLGVKLDMTNYSLLLDHQQVEKVKEITGFDSKESQEKENEMSKLKDQLNEFIEERESWLDEINQRQTEMVAARIMLEKLRQREQSLTTENEILKADTAKYKMIAMQLEDEVKKLSNQQNLQQRIHHHAKTKEENSLLKLQNEELNAKLERSEVVLSRVKEELARYRASSGKKPYVDIDEEEHLRKRLDDKEEERMQLAQKLLSLCTGILKAAGLPHSAPSVSPSAAEDALNQLNDRTNALETELQDLKLQCRVSCEKIRLSELKQQQSSPSDEGSFEEADGVQGSLSCDSLALS